ncbi:hypothetical protein EYF80_005581 [Liparis tanakae]|uniref:Uncharacterized protein n=1 Tax=Liparis tanakae TaxID=230148 RepID=A0A4Z2J329_9TELE|nr:hypothetical protein EYF80_005581 [Liparis tanakae]
MSAASLALWTDSTQPSWLYDGQQRYSALPEVPMPRITSFKKGRKKDRAFSPTAGPTVVSKKQPSFHQVLPLIIDGGRLSRPSHTPRDEQGRVKFLCGNWRVQSSSLRQEVSLALASSRSVSFSSPATVTNCRGWKSNRATEPRGDWERKWRSRTRSRHTWEEIRQNRIRIDEHLFKCTGTQSKSNMLSLKLRKPWTLQQLDHLERIPLLQNDPTVALEKSDILAPNCCTLLIKSDTRIERTTKARRAAARKELPISGMFPPVAQLLAAGKTRTASGSDDRSAPTRRSPDFLCSRSDQLLVSTSPGTPSGGVSCPLVTLHPLNNFAGELDLMLSPPVAVLLRNVINKQHLPLRSELVQRARCSSTAAGWTATSIVPSITAAPPIRMQLEAD